MHILIIFDHDENVSFCLDKAIYNCLIANKHIFIYLKNLNKTFPIEEAIWYQNQRKIFGEKIKTYKGISSKQKVDVLCSLTCKTPSFFLQSQKPKKIGLFFEKRVITNDYASPFLMMSSTPNKLNRENLYDLILNGKISEHLSRKISGHQRDDRSLYSNEEIYLKKNENLVIKNFKNTKLKDTITSSNVILYDQENNEYRSNKLGTISYFSTTDAQNLLEEIIHLSILFSIFDIDYQIPDADINQASLEKFNETLENAFEALNFIKIFCEQKDIIKVRSALKLTDTILSQYNVFKTLSEYFTILNNTSNITENDMELYFNQINTNCDVLHIVCKTAYHLSSQKIQPTQKYLSKNN